MLRKNINIIIAYMSGVMKIMCTFNELRCKEVINIKDGRKLGYVDDAELETVGGT